MTGESSGMDDRTSLKVLQDQHALLARNLAKLAAACKTDEERERLGVAFDLAGRNLADARNRIFNENRAEVKRIMNQLGAAETEIASMIRSNEEIVQVLDAITRVVDLGKQLVLLGSSAIG